MVVVAVEMSDVSLTVMLVGAIVLAGATVIVATMPNLRLPRWQWRRRRHAAAPPPHTPLPVAQRRVVTGRRPELPPPGTPLPDLVPRPAVAPPRQHAALPDGQGPTAAEVQRAEAVIDQFLDTDPKLLAETLTAWMAIDDKSRRHR
jgi:hypothetical protein